MAEGWAQKLKADEIEAYSAGIEKHGLNPNAVQVMAEAGVDITGQQSQTLEDLGHVVFDVVVTVCDHAAEKCPVFHKDATSQTVIKHVPFEDPPKLAAAIEAAGGTEEEQLAPYRKVRDQIRDFVETLPDSVR